MTATNSPETQPQGVPKRDDYDLAYGIVEQMGLGLEFRNCSCGQLPCARLRPIVEALTKRGVEVRAGGDHIHWLFKRGTEETMCGRETAKVKTSLLPDFVTCPFCNIAFCGYKLGRAHLPRATADYQRGLLEAVAIAGRHRHDYGDNKTQCVAHIIGLIKEAAESAPRATREPGNEITAICSALAQQHHSERHGQFKYEECPVWPCSDLRRATAETTVEAWQLETVCFDRQSVN